MNRLLILGCATLVLANGCTWVHMAPGEPEVTLKMETSGWQATRRPGPA